MSTTTATPTLRNFIDGAFVDSADGATEPVVNPATGEELAQAASSTPEDVQEAVAAARRAFASWSRTTPAERSQALLAMAERLEENGEELARLEALNAGKPLAAVTSDEIPVMADNLRGGTRGLRILGEDRVPVGHRPSRKRGREKNSG